MKLFLCRWLTVLAPVLAFRISLWLFAVLPTPLRLRSRTASPPSEDLTKTSKVSLPAGVADIELYRQRKMSSHTSKTCVASRDRVGEMKRFLFTLMEMPGHDIEIEADFFVIESGGALVFYRRRTDGKDEIIRAVNARVWRVCEAL
jgi:hypothetical protein